MRRDMFIVLLSVVLAFIAGLTGARLGHRGYQPTVRASRFILDDGSGRTVASWGYTTRGNVITFLDGGGRSRLTLGTAHGGAPLLEMTGSDEKVRLNLELNTYEKPYLGMSDSGYEGRILIGSLGTDTPSLPDTMDEWGILLRAPGQASGATMHVDPITHKRVVHSVGIDEMTVRRGPATSD